MTKIIAFAGRKQSGKSTSANFVANEFDTSLVGKAKVYNFADPLKHMCMEILGLTINQCYGEDEEKNQLVDCYWEGKQLTAREVMQIVGTDMFRKMQHNVWADATIRRIQKEKFDLALIADCRFPNEVEAVKNAGGIVIKLNRDLYHSDHSSETALDSNNYDQNIFDLVIENENLDVDEKNSIVQKFLQSNKILTI